MQRTKANGEWLLAKGKKIVLTGDFFCIYQKKAVNLQANLKVMAEHEAIKLFEENKMRVFFDDVQEKWYICINDVIQVLTDSKDPADYFKKMRRRDPELDNFVRGTNCPPPPIISDKKAIDYIKPKDELPFEEKK